MELFSLLGKPLRHVQEMYSDDIISFDTVSKVVEVGNVTIKGYADETHHALLYYDITNTDNMNIAIFKIHNVNLFERLKILFRFSKDRKGDFFGCVTVMKTEVWITYVRRTGILDKL